MKGSSKRVVVIVFSVVFVLSAFGIGFAASKLDDFNAMVDKKFAEAMAPQNYAVPAKGPKAVPNKKIVDLGHIMAASTIRNMVGFVDEGMKAIGWNHIIIDGQADQAKWADAVEKTIAMKADGFVAQIIDAERILEPLRQLKKAKIPAGGYQNINKENLYDFDVAPLGLNEEEGYLQALASYKLAGHKMKMIAFISGSCGPCALRWEGAEKFMKEAKAAGASVEYIDQIFMPADLHGAQFEQQAISVARRMPGFNVIYAVADTDLYPPIDALTNAGMIPDPSKIMAVGINAEDKAVESIKKGGVIKGSLAMPSRFQGWSQADQLNRIFAGQKPIEIAIKPQLLVKENVEAWKGGPDPAPGFKALWGK